MPFRVGVIPLPFKGHSIPALKYFILHLNTIQSLLEFEVLPSNDESDIWPLLRSDNSLDRDEMRDDALGFAGAYLDFLRRQSEHFRLNAQHPDHLVVISPARFKDNFYTMQEGQLTILAMGNWSRAMAPPSLLEFLYVLIVRYALAAAYPALRAEVHYATRGCLFDFTAHLSDLRFKVLNAYLCSTCKTALERAAGADAVVQLSQVLAKTWVGQPHVRGTPAAIMSKLGYDLFLTSGARATTWEKFKKRLEEEWLKQLLDFFLKLALAAAVFWLGFKTAT